MKLPSLIKPPNDQPTDPAAQLTVADVIAPAEVEVDFNELRINSRFYRTYFVSGYPRFVEPNWLEPLVSFDHSLFISMFIYPNESRGVLDELKHKIAEMEATIQTDAERGKAIDPAVEVALDDARSLQDQLVKGVERFFQFSLYVTIPSNTKDDLKNTSKMIESTLASLSIIAKPTTLQMTDGLISTLPFGEDRLNLNHNMDTTSLATTFPFASSELTANEGIMYGINEHNESLILFDRFSLENANSVVFAKSGSGKSVSYDQPVLIKENGQIQLLKIGGFVDKLIAKKGADYFDHELEGVEEPKVQVFTFDNKLKGQWSDVTIAARKKEAGKLYYFETLSGRNIKVTKDHNLVILREGRVVTVKSHEIKKGDVIPVPRQLPAPEKPTLSLYPLKILKESGSASILFRSTKGYRVGSKYRQDKTSLPYKIKVNDKFARLLGYITAEGWIGDRYLTISNINLEVLADIKASLTDLGLSFNEARKDNKITAVNVNARIFTKFINSLGAGGRSGNKQIPGFIFNCSNFTIAEYLKAYFEGDGGVEKHEITAATKSGKLASDLAYLLMRFGIISRLKITSKKPYYRVVISGQDNISKFGKNIGFVTTEKNNKLQDLLKLNTHSNTNVNTIPTLEPIFKKVWEVLYNCPYLSSPANLSAIKRGVFSPSPQTVRSVIDEIENRINCLSTVTASRLKYLRSLPRQSVILESGRLIPQINSLLWQELGESWRLSKNGLVTMGIGNALRASRVIFNQNYDLNRIRTEIINSFAELNLSLEKFDPTLWNYLRYRPSSRGSYERILQAIDYLTKEYNNKMSQINALKEELGLLDNLANSDLFWDPIVKIDKEKSTNKYVYDLTVDNQVFLTGFGGMFVHNSYFVKLEALRSLMFGTEIFVIDPEQEYLPLCQAVGGDYINFSISSPVKINPFDLSSNLSDGGNELGHKILSLTSFLKLVLGSLDPVESAVLDRALKQTYQLRGITDDPKTQSNTPPLMEDLYKVLIGMEEKTALGLATRLERFIKGSLAGIFSSQSNINLTSSFVVFSVRDLPDQLRPLAMHMILEFIWTKIRSKLKKRILIVDEAWYLMRNPDSAEFLVDMAKRARKYYLGLTTITQDVEDFLNGDRGKEIISNSSIQVLLKQAPASIDRLAEVFNLSEGEQRMLLSAGIGQGLFFAGSTHVAMRVVASKQEHQLITSNPAERLAQSQTISNLNKPG